jgi:hypothetical protein
MEDTYDDQAPGASRRGFGELLKEKYVTALGGGAFEKLSHLVDNKEDTVSRPLGGLLSEPLNQVPSRGDFPTRPSAGQPAFPASLFQGHGDIGHRVAAPTDDRYHQPPIAGRTEGVEQALGGLVTQSGDGGASNRTFGPEQASQDHGQTRFTPTVRSSPSESPLRGLGNLPGHTEEAVSSRPLADEALQRIDPS